MESFRLESVKELRGDEKIADFDRACHVIRDLKKHGHDIVLAQGVFDIVHAGHVGYLRAAAAVCNLSGLVVVGLENDASVALNKGLSRPVNEAAERAQVLAEFESVGLVFTYPDVPTYDDSNSFLERYQALQPSSIAVASFDPHLDLKRWQAAETGTTITPLVYRHENSTTRMLKKLGYEH